MLDASDLRTLTRWCHERRLHWQPGVAEDGAAALLLHGAGRSAGQAMLLVAEAEEMRLLGPRGDNLAVASDLPALLDAVDGGVAEPAYLSAPSLGFGAPVSLVAAIASGRNRLGSVIT